MEKQTKNRLTLIAVLLVFAAPILIAGFLTHSGWHPEKTRNYGTLVEPARDVSATPVTLDDGARFSWKDEQWHWTLLALPSAECATNCQANLAALLRMRITLNRNAERLRVLYLGAPLPAEAVKAYAPLLTGNDTSQAFAEYRPAGDDELALALVDPNGLLMLRLDAGYSVAHLRDDLMKVVH